VVFEELKQGDDDEPRRLSRAAWALVALAGVLTGAAFLAGRGLIDRTDESKPAPSSPSWSQPSPHLDPDQALAIQSTCPPLTDGRTRLTVSFTLRNVGTQNVTLVDVVPRLPIGGLLVKGPVTAGGSCGLPGVLAPGGLLVPGQTQVISMVFRLPKGCPQPSPVPVQVTLRAEQMVGTTTVTVLGDLGSVNFDTCPKPT